MDAKKSIFSFQQDQNIFNEFLEDINEDALPNGLTGYQDSQIWNKLFNFLILRLALKNENML